VPGQCALQDGDQQGKLYRDDPPDDVVVDPVIAVDDSVAGADRVVPGISG
jgi:hypothetical protein